MVAGKTQSIGWIVAFALAGSFVWQQTPLAGRVKLGGNEPAVTRVAPTMDQIMERVNALDLSLIQYRLEAKLDFTPERATETIKEYRRFLGLCVRFPKVSVVPALDVDEAWHAHILHTAKYAQDCHAIAGRFIHHRPSTPEEEVAEKERRHVENAPESGYQRTLRLYEQEFATKPNHVWTGLPTIIDLTNCSSCGSSCNTHTAHCSSHCTATIYSLDFFAAKAACGSACGANTASCGSACGANTKPAACGSNCGANTASCGSACGANTKPAACGSNCGTNTASCGSACGANTKPAACGSACGANTAACGSACGANTKPAACGSNCGANTASCGSACGANTKPAACGSACGANTAACGSNCGSN